MSWIIHCCLVTPVGLKYLAQHCMKDYQCCLIYDWTNFNYQIKILNACISFAKLRLKMSAKMAAIVLRPHYILVHLFLFSLWHCMGYEQTSISLEMEDATRSSYEYKGPIIPDLRQTSRPNWQSLPHESLILASNEQVYFLRWVV